MQLDTPEWGSEADGWFRRSIHRLLCGEYLDGLPRACRDEPELLDAMVDVLADRHAEYVRWIDAPYYDPEMGTEGRWVLDLDALNHAPLWSIAEAVELQRDLKREAERFPTLDDWLSALVDGDVADGPFEPWGSQLLPPTAARTFLKARRRRQREWPRLCSTCGREFRGDRANATRCRGCRSRQAAQRNTG